MKGARSRLPTGRQGLHAVVPVKSLAHSKSRLAPLLGTLDRQRLTLAMCADILQRLRLSPVIESIIVVTRDAQVAALARAVDSFVITQRADRGLTAAVKAAAVHLVRQGAENLLYLPCDVPLLSDQDLEALWSVESGAPSVAIVPSHDARGTNCLLCRPPKALSFAFEGSSFQRHLMAARVGNIRTEVLHLSGPALDIDEPEDVARFLKHSKDHHLAGGVRTRRLLLEELQLGQEMAGPGDDNTCSGLGMGM